MKIERPNKSLADLAYETLKNAIIYGKLAEGELLPEAKLAAELGISRTPLRDALARLAMEGLIEHELGKPSKVSGFSKTLSLQFMEIRRLLEVYNIEKIITKIDDKFIRLLEENLVRQKQAIENNEYNKFIDQDREFHLLLASLNHNSELRKIIHRVNTGTNRAFIILSKTVPQSAKAAYEEHKAIVAALKARDVVESKNKMLLHMQNVEHRFLTLSE